MDEAPSKNEQNKKVLKRLSSMRLVNTIDHPAASYIPLEMVEPRLKGE